MVCLVCLKDGLNRGCQRIAAVSVSAGILRQLKIILLKDNRLAKSVNYIQYYALFWSLSLFISEILIKFMSLS